MKNYPTWCDHRFHGYEDIKEIHRLQNEARELAIVKQKGEQADHMIYCSYEIDDNGDINTAWLYSGLPLTDTEFERIAKLPNNFIGAIHKQAENQIKKKADV